MDALTLYMSNASIDDIERQAHDRTSLAQAANNLEYNIFQAVDPTTTSESRFKANMFLENFMNAEQSVHLIKYVLDNNTREEVLSFVLNKIMQALSLLWPGVEILKDSLGKLASSNPHISRNIQTKAVQNMVAILKLKALSEDYADVLTLFAVAGEIIYAGELNVLQTTEICTVLHHLLQVFNVGKLTNMASQFMGVRLSIHLKVHKYFQTRFLTSIYSLVALAMSKCRTKMVFFSTSEDYLLLHEITTVYEKVLEWQFLAEDYCDQSFAHLTNGTHEPLFQPMVNMEFWSTVFSEGQLRPILKLLSEMWHCPREFSATHGIFTRLACVNLSVFSNDIHITFVELLLEYLPTNFLVVTSISSEDGRETAAAATALYFLTIRTPLSARKKLLPQIVDRSLYIAAACAHILLERQDSYSSE